jgi:hypothetical protein
VCTVTRSRTKFLVLLAFLVVMLPAGILAQTASLQGTVTDPQDKVVPGAEITLTNKATSATRATLSGDHGDFLFVQVSPGTYQLKAELSGFRTVLADNLRLAVDTATTLNLKFTELGEVSETVLVTAERLINKVDATVGNPFNELQIRQLPIESRNVVDLLKLQAGVTQDGYVAGSRSDQSNLTLDGIDVNEQQTGAAFESVLRVTPDSVQEFRVTITNPNANQGRSAGAQVSLVTKSGTNDWHGNALWFHRNTVTTANNFFNNRALDEEGKPKAIPRPKLIRNLYGGSIGGPIATDKAFFFFNYEGRKDRKQESVVRTVPLAHLGQGTVKYINTANETVTLTAADIAALYPSLGGVNPNSVAVLAGAAQRYPANDDGAGDGINTGGFRFNAPLPLNWSTYTAKVDFNLSEKHQVFVRANYQWDNEVLWNAVTETAQWFPDTPDPMFWNHPIGVAASHTWSPGSTFLNTFRYGLTRQAFSSQGDSAANSISFREVFQPLYFSRSLTRTTPVHNLVDDVSWIAGRHTWQFGTNIRLVRNERTSFAAAYDRAVANFSWYQQSGAVLTQPIAADLSAGSDRPYRRAISAVIGRLNDYFYNFNFGADGNLLSPGSPSDRAFATEEYELYFQDNWKVVPSLTLTFGLRWGVNTPVYETTGFQVKPTISLGDYFERRKTAAGNGSSVYDPIKVDLAGPRHNKPGWYEQDWNNFAPRISAAWSPSAQSGILRTLLGSKGQTSLRGGFGMMYDRIGSALAVFYDLNNTLGFSSNEQLPANYYNVTTNPAPLFEGFDQNLRGFPGLTTPNSLVFPLEKPSDNARRIESTLDDTLTTPVNYVWNVSWGRELPRGFFVEATYLGRRARDLMAQRDIMALNNLRDPKSGMDWYTAGRQIADLYAADTPIENVAPIAYFENLFPAAAFGTDWFGYDGPLTATQQVYALVTDYNGPDWTYLQNLLQLYGDPVVTNPFYHPQYGALNAWSTVGRSDYHAFTLSARQRFKSLSADFNYTWSKSMDNASGLQNSAAFGGGFIVNPLLPESSRSVSDFDVAHMINSNWLWELPFGRGHRFLSTLPGVTEAILGGWEFNGIFRWNSGLPNTADMFDAGYWATNWNLASAGTRLRDPNAKPTKQGDHPNLFQDPKYAYQSYRNAYPGETGDRNVLRLDGYVALDFGLGKKFRIPNTEGHSVALRWEVFNATNTQRLGSNLAWYGLGYKPYEGEPSPDFGKITSIQGSPRVMQFGLRYDF